MSTIRLATFIQQNVEPILQAWEDFARTIEPPALTMDDEELRDHARQMLQVIAADLSLPQTDRERDLKSKGLAEPEHHDSAAEAHAEARLLSGYTVVQLVSEYRALRSSVLTLWAARNVAVTSTDLGDITRFNEAIDQSLAESIARYEWMVKQSQNMFLAILGHDLRNPLGTITTATSFLMQAVDVPPKYVLVATRMFNSAQRMSRLINDLIDFTRTHLGAGIPVKTHEANLSRVCRDVVDEMRRFHPDQRGQSRQPATQITNQDQRGRSAGSVAATRHANHKSAGSVANQRGQSRAISGVSRGNPPNIAATVRKSDRDYDCRSVNTFRAAVWRGLRFAAIRRNDLQFAPSCKR